MLQFDHLTLTAPSLAEGIAHLTALLGIELGNAAKHKDMATHNRRVRLGADIYLEVVASAPDATPKGGPRWFGLDRVDEVRAAWDGGFRLRGWVARTDDIDAVLADHGRLLGTKRRLDDSYDFSVPVDGGLPLGGVLPSVIDLGGKGPTAERLVDQGIRLRSFVLEHPDPHEVSRLYEALGVGGAPRVARGERMRYVAEVETPAGVVVLT